MKQVLFINVVLFIFICDCYAYDQKPLSDDQAFEDFAKFSVYNGVFDLPTKLATLRVLMGSLDLVSDIHDEDRPLMLVTTEHLCRLINVYNQKVSKLGGGKNGKEAFDEMVKKQYGKDKSKNAIDQSIGLVLECIYRLLDEKKLKVSDDLRAEIDANRDKPIYEQYYKSVIK